MIELWPVLLPVISYRSIFAQKVKHAPTVEQCQVDQRFSTSKLEEPDMSPLELDLTNHCPSGHAPLPHLNAYPRRETLARKLRHLGIVLLVSLPMSLVACVYILSGGKVSTGPMEQQYGLATGLISEATALAVLWYVMGMQGKTWKDISMRPALADVPRALYLFIATEIAAYVLLLPIQYGYRAYSGHFLTAKSLGPLLGLGISSLSIAFVFLNPFFEELIVRAYAISEVINLGGSRSLAVIFSVVCQISYHLYQGAAHVLALTILFTAFSIYYVRTRRIGPVILIHLFVDVSFLIQSTR